MMSEAALDEVSVLSSIYCGEGEFVLQEAGQDGLIVQINCTGGGEDGLVGLLFHLHPGYPSCPPDISVSSTALSRTQCQSVRQRLQERASELPPEPMVHQLVEFFQECVELTEGCRGAVEAMKPREQDDEWTAVLLLDHMRARNRYVGLLERWSQQLQLAGALLLGQRILVILQGARHSVKEFCHRLKTVKVDVDSSGKKCKERMMKVLIETPSSSPGHHSIQGFIVKNYESVTELSAAFEHFHMTDLYQRIFPSLKD
ncbi:RWD domain-containing protein 3 isoform X2 [Salarias fasciatus]|uniref:RWD domain-containing protein 3 isoform X2 n=1 Tax=Salarias fasciatus TaxID=181472 RepID=UPI001176D771|nr:RWD domain-containing protein 3 isoform X2 [Salarias fasciatus]